MFVSYLSTVSRSRNNVDESTIIFPISFHLAYFVIQLSVVLVRDASSKYWCASDLTMEECSFLSLCSSLAVMLAVVLVALYLLFSA